MKSHKFVDSAKATLIGGRGGNGCLSFRREKFVPYGGPDGGNGGRGGHVLIQADRNTDSLLNFYYRPLRRAGDGGHGRGKQQQGRNAKDLLILVPCGTQIYDADSGSLLADLTTAGQRYLAASGGRGGLGNHHFKTATHQAPREHTPGQPGEEKRVRLELKIIAEVGLIGFPNAGKSTLLSALSQARPKIAAYPFTTLNPIIGTLWLEPYRDIRIVDVPGLIAGAHRGAGLGHTFLRHVERTRFLILVIDMAGTDQRHPADDYAVLMEELRQHNPQLIQRPSLCLANKMDLAPAAAHLAEFIQRTGQKPLPISAKKAEGLEALLAALRAQLLDQASVEP